VLGYAASSDAVRDYYAGDEGCFISCRSYTVNIQYGAKSSPKGLVTLAAYEVINIGEPVNNTLTGITL
jgi:hypothetical protein